MLLKQKNYIAFYTIFSFIFFIIIALSPCPSFASIHNWQTTLQEPASVNMEKFVDFHRLLLKIITAVVIFVFILLSYTCVRYYHKNNPIPQKITHNVFLEIIWTLVPFIILAIIAIPSFRILYFVDTIGKMDMTVKIVGRQWYWQYEYPDNQIAFDSNIVPDQDLKPGQLRLFDVDNPIVLPVDTNIRLVITSGDVIHSFAVPAFGIKTDAIPGRINETWVKITKPGTYYGQCSELCGVGHGFMPIAIKAVQKDEYNQWLLEAKTKFASN